MTTLSNHLPAEGISAGQSYPGHYRYATSSRELAVSTSQSSATTVVLETKEGDRVSLNVSAFSRMDASGYTREGVLENESGSVLLRQNQRQITLASGQSFSFAVEGELSDGEREDIEALMLDLDGVMNRMQKGDMQQALKKVLDISSLETVSSFTADLSFESRYEARAASTAETASFSPSVQESGFPPTPADRETGSLTLPAPFTRFFESLLEIMEKHDDTLVRQMKNPIAKLFTHHRDSLAQGSKHGPVLADMLDKVQKKVFSLIEQIPA